MKKGIVYTSLPNLEPEERFQLAARAGYAGVEIMSADSAEQLQQMKAAADAAGVAIPSIMLRSHWSHPFSAADAATRRHSAEHLAFNLEHAHLAGADTILVVPGVVNAETSYEQAWERALPELKALAPLAEKHGVTIALENVWNRFLLSPLEMRRFVEEIGSSHVKVYFDCGNILAYGFPQQWIRSLGSLIHRVHVKDFRTADRQFVYLLQGDVPWAPVMSALRAVGYDSYLTAELPLYPHFPEQMPLDTSRALDVILELAE